MKFTKKLECPRCRRTTEYQTGEKDARYADMLPIHFKAACKDCGRMQPALFGVSDEGVGTPAILTEVVLRYA